MVICLDMVCGGKGRRETKQSAGCMMALGVSCMEVHPLMDGEKDALGWRGEQGWERWDTYHAATHVACGGRLMPSCFRRRLLRKLAGR